MTTTKEFHLNKPEAFLERPIPELGVVMIRLEGTKEELADEMAKLALRYPDQLSTFDDAQLISSTMLPWQDEDAGSEKLFEEIYSLWVVRKL
jgi:hypothetical protein